MNLTRSQREHKAQLRKAYLRRCLIVCGILLLYYLEVMLIGLRIPCPIRLVTGHRCPGCGISTMLIHCSKGELHEGFHSNQVLFFAVPVLVIGVIVKLIWMPRFLTPQSKFYRITSYVFLAVLLVFGVLRNVYEF
ncbi:MAG: DUF2752 domain-containing protein [Oscillospiraceae bacterium]|nr:DUF2752 domain-containing protein [Oscillospiraceae bacterium]